MGFIKEKGLVTVCTCESRIMTVKRILNMCSAGEVWLLDTAVDSWCGGAVSMGDIIQLCWVLFSIFLQILFVTVR